MALYMIQPTLNPQSLYVDHGTTKKQKVLKMNNKMSLYWDCECSKNTINIIPKENKGSVGLFPPQHFP